jgi:ankyrin repeat protein
MAAQGHTKVKGYELERAAQHGMADEILRLWRKYGDTLDVEHKGRGGWTPLHWTVWKGHGEACRALVSTCGANVDSRISTGSTPLIVAASYNHLQCVEVLLELGADLALRNVAGVTALDCARKFPNSEVAALLESAEKSPMVKSANKL